MADLDAIRREIAELHDFFEDWFNGDLAQTDANFDRFASVLADDFALVDIDADITRRGALLDAIWDHWGHPADEGREMTIETDSVELLREDGDLLLATYFEHQTNGDDSNTRRSSVLFRRDADASNGLVWLYVHETPVE